MKNFIDNSQRNEFKKKFIIMMEKIFQFDRYDVDFGLYRILNTKRKEIADFIEKNLFDIITKEFNVFDNNFLLKSPIKSPLEIQSDILNHLFNFFLHYYYHGKLIIPHNENDTYFCRTNYDQYYIQNIEPFNNDRDNQQNIIGEPTKNKNHDITQRSSDYFIHKDLKGFLTKELDYYIKNEILDIDSLTTNNFTGVFTGLKDGSELPNITEEELIILQFKKIKIFKSISIRIIENLAQIEEVKKKLWEKPKFVLSNEYCIPLEKIDKTLYGDIFQNSDQLEEWKKLFNLNFMRSEKNLVFKDSNSKLHLNEKYRKLPVDSKFYNDDFKQKLIDNICKNNRLDENFDGILILSNNFHALNLLRFKYSKKIKCIYIDPPYNTENDNFLYGDKFKSGSWISMMKENLILASEFLHKNGTLCISIDDNELHNLLHLVYDIFGQDFCKTIAVKVAEPTGVKMAHVVNLGGIAKLKEYLILVKKNGISDLNLEKIPKENWDDAYNLIVTNIKAGEIYKIKKVMHKENPTLFDIEEIDDILKNFQLEPLEAYMKNLKIKKKNRDEWKIDNAWRILRTVSTSKGAKRIADKKKKTNSSPFFSILTQKNKIYIIKSDYDSDQSEPRIKLLFADDYLSIHPGDFWYDIKTTGLDKEGNITFKSGKKPEKLLKRIITMTTDEGDTVLDFFVGSGTSAAVAHKLKRKWIGVEIDPTIYNIALERMKHVIFGENFGISKKIRWNGGGSFRYLSLEQYQDSLQNLISKNSDKITIESEDSKISIELDKLSNNNIKYIVDFRLYTSPIFMNINSIDNPFGYYIKTKTNDGIKMQKIDIIETFNYIAGISVESISKRKNGEINYFIVKGYRKEKNVIVIWRNKPPTFILMKDKEFVETEILRNNEFDEIFINGKSSIKKSVFIDNIFLKKIF